MNRPREGTRALVERRAIVGTIAVALTLFGASTTPTGALEPPTFSGVNCSMTNCDCNCIAAEQQKAGRAVESLGVDLPSSLNRTPGRLSPAAALTRLRRLHTNVAYVLLLLQRSERDPIGAATVAEIHAGLPEAAGQLGLPAPPPGWSWDERYLGSLDNSIRAEIDRVFPLTERQTEIEKELNTCRQWADHKKCDPSLGTQGGSTTPPRAQPPAPPAPTTPPREMWPPDRPKPFARHPDGRPYVDDELLTRYIAAKRAQDAGEPSPWRQGGFGQSDFADVHQRVDAWARSHGTATQAQLFDAAELDAFRHREKEVRQAYTGLW